MSLNHLLVLILTFSVFSCSKESDHFNPMEKPLLLPSTVENNKPDKSSPVILLPEENTPEPEEIPQNPIPGGPVISGPAIPPPTNTPENPPTNRPENPPTNTPGNPPTNTPENPPSDSAEAGVKPCRYSFGTTSMESNVKVTIFSGPKEILQTLVNEETLRLSQEDRDFMFESLNGPPAGVPVVSSKRTNGQAVSDRLVVLNDDEASVRINHVAAGVTLNYLIKGKAASFRANTLNRNARIFAVLDGSESASVDFTRVEGEGEIFLFFMTKGDNVTCSRVTGMDGKFKNFVYGEEGYITQGILRGTGMAIGGQIEHHVFGHDNTLSLLRGTSIEDNQIKVETRGRDNTRSLVKFTSLKGTNGFNLDVRGRNNVELNLEGTSAGDNTIVNLNVRGLENTKGSFKFTSENNISINGRMLGKDPLLHLLGRIGQTGTKAKVNVTLEKID